MPLSDVLTGWVAEPIRPGIALSGAAVERLTRSGEPERFHKVAAPTWDRGLDAEADRLRWLATTPLAGRVATLVFHGVDEQGIEHLVTSAVPGRDGAGLAELVVAEHDGDAARDLASQFGAALRVLHESLDPATCPFDRRLDTRLAAAARRVVDGGVDLDDLEPEHAGKTGRQLLDELRATRPANEDLVVTHGDWCFPNVLFDDEGGWGMVDLADLGVACRWYDLGIGARTTLHNLGAGAIPAFLEGYGVDADEERLRYYLLLDEVQ